jgi:hypothetical protein
MLTTNQHSSIEVDNSHGSNVITIANVVITYIVYYHLQFKKTTNNHSST